MKKMISVLFIIISIGTLAAQVKITNDPSQDIQVRGSIYLPLILNTVWHLESDEVHDGAEFPPYIHWELKRIVRIADPSLGINNLRAYESHTGDGDISYFLEFDGFICSYQQGSDDKWYLERLIPVNPVIGDLWISQGIQYTVIEMDSDLLKVQFSNELSYDTAEPVTDIKSGYILYAKNIGFSELFFYNTFSGEQYFVTYKLKNNQSKIIALSEGVNEAPGDDMKIIEVDKDTKLIDKNELFKPLDKSSKTEAEDTSNKKISETKISSKDSNESKEGLKSNPQLKKDKTYIQIGAFKNRKNADEITKRAVQQNYRTVVLVENGGLIRVLIEIDPAQTTGVLQKVRQSINKESFIKK